MDTVLRDLITQNFEASILWVLLVIAILISVGVRKLYVIANHAEISIHNLSRELKEHEDQMTYLLGVNREINRTLQERLLNLRDGIPVYVMNFPEKDE
jgi:hypothetical protein